MRQDDRANQGVIRHAIRAIGTSFYLIVPEAGFLQLIYALDALAAVNVTGKKHRRYIAALTCSFDEGDPRASRERFEQRLATFSELYSIRNQIVHEGATFASLGQDAARATDRVCLLVRACFQRLLTSDLRTVEAVRDHASEVLRMVGTE